MEIFKQLIKIYVKIVVEDAAKIVDVFIHQMITGCELEDSKRLQGGILYIPSKDRNCRGLYTDQIGYQEWSNHQKVLERLTKYFCGKTSQEKIR